MEKPEDDIQTDDLANWMFEYWGNLDYDIQRLAALVEEMHTFSTKTKNLHKEMKGWCTDLSRLTGLVVKRSEALKTFVDKSADRIDELSSSLLEASSVANRVDTSDIGVGTETEAGLEKTKRESEEQKIIHKTNTKHRRDSLRGHSSEAKSSDSKKKKVKMKKGDNSQINTNTQTVIRQQKEDYRKTPHEVKKKNETVIIRPNCSTSYAEVVRKLKDNIDINALNVSVKTMRKSEKGDLILQIDKGKKQVEAAERLRKAIVEVLGKEAKVEFNPKATLVEIKDLESETTEEEVKNAVAKATDTSPNSISVIRILPSFGGDKMAVVKINCKEAEKLNKAGKLTVGLVRCRVKLKPPIIRCYRCHEYGHFIANCRGPDRRDQCMTCGQTDHKAKTCVAPPRCVICGDKGLNQAHYPGSAKCEAVRGRKQQKEIFI